MRSHTISLRFLVLILCAGFGLTAHGQTIRPNSSLPSTEPRQQQVAQGPAAPAPAVQIAQGDSPANAMSDMRRNMIAGTGRLPNDHGQVWREFDIRPYTERVTSTTRPEQAIIDWVLRETGYEAWHSEVASVLTADQRTLRVYHTPQMVDVVGSVIDRFLNTEAETHAVGLRVITITSPNWRARAQRMLTPVEVQTPGVQAWLLAKEDASLLVAELRKRSDFREHSSPHLLVQNGQSAVVSLTRSRNYVRELLLKPTVWPGYEATTGQIDEGFSLELNPLLTNDQRMVDAILKVNVDQVEKLVPVMIDVPTAVAPRQRAKVEVPQLSQCRVHERFHWPVERVMLVGLGVVPTPLDTDPNPLQKLNPLATPQRADLLVFIESKGTQPIDPAAARVGSRETDRFRGRY